MSWLTRILGLSREHNFELNERAEKLEKGADALGEGIEKLGTATEFLETVAGKLEATGMDAFADAIEQALPWATAAGEVIGEAVPPVKAVLKIIGFLTKETDPRALGILAFSLAYQSALSGAVKAIQEDPEQGPLISQPITVRGLRSQLQREPEQLEEFDSFTLENSFTHPMMRRADDNLMLLAHAAGWPDEIGRRLLEAVHARFQSAFRNVVADGRTREKFDPVMRAMQLDARGRAAFAAVERHIDFQLWSFNNAPALGSLRDVREGLPMSLGAPLREIYVPPDCGKLDWSEIDAMRRPAQSGEKRRTPFDENEGGRSPMLQTVLDLLGQKDFEDAMVIQGVAGAGKSTFTLRLCVELRRRGLRPIRVRMRHLLLDGTALLDDIAHAVLQNSGDQAYIEETGLPLAETDRFDARAMFKEEVAFGNTKISPFVLIFDGWDEISVSASEGLRQRIQDTLIQIRKQIIDHHQPRVRVILTGRPSLDVQEVGFLLRRTPVLTIRPMRNPDVERFAHRLLECRLYSAPNDRETLTGRIERLLAETDAAPNVAEHDRILGLPLLALLAVWLTLNDPAAGERMATDRTALYRRLVELTCRYGGNVQQVEAAARIVGEPLRELLHRTAAAMTMMGGESLSYRELEHRLPAAGMDGRDETLQATMQGNPIANLMISFFFSVSTREHGCEFVHKSFREYLFAEAVVETLKSITSAPADLSARAPYWREFDSSDLRRAVVRSLAPMLAAQWITGDVSLHIDALIAWEISRAAHPGEETGDRTEPLSMDDWRRIRDVLAALWDWWGEGVHLRPQPYYHPDTAALTYSDPEAVRLAKVLAPVDLGRGQLPEPIRTTTIDSHLGDALFRLNCTVHFRINEATGWLDRPPPNKPGDLPRALWAEAQTGVRRYQTVIRQDGKEWVAFAPSTPDGREHYLHYYGARIVAAGWRPDLDFPIGVDMRGVDLSETTFPAVRGDREDGTKVGRLSCQYGRLAGAKVHRVMLEQADFRNAAAQDADFSGAITLATDFSGADLSQASFLFCVLATAIFHAADVTGARFDNARILGIDRDHLTGAQLTDALFEEERLKPGVLRPVTAATDGG